MSTYNFTKASANSDQLAGQIRTSSITIALDHIDYTGDQLEVIFKAALSIEDQAVLTTVVSNHIPQQVIDPVLSVNVNTPKTTTGYQKVSVFEPEGASATLVTHNFADKSSWYMGSVLLTSRTLSSSDSLSFQDNNSKTHWIDMKHGRLYDEDNILFVDPTLHPKIYVDGVLKAEKLINYDTMVTSGDYLINYATGVVTFDTAVVGVVTANYRYADKSWYRVRPRPSKILSIKLAEVQFAQGTTLNSPFIFEPWFVDHPQLGTRPVSEIVPGQQIAYKNFKDFISSCNGGQDLIPKIGELSTDVHVFPFNYARPKPIKYSECIEIRVFCKSHRPVGGTYATATFYVTIDNETV